MNCSLIICTYNWPEALDMVLSSVLNQSITPNEVIIADDGSSESTFKVIKAYSDEASIPIIHSWQKDDGCRISHSRNRAIAKSNYEYIIMVDGDTVLHKDFIKDHKRFAQQGLYIQGSRVLLQSEFSGSLFKENFFKKPSFFLKDSKNKINMLRLPFLTKFMSFFKNQNINRIRGCNFSIFKEDVIKVNGFNEDITTWGREDSEFVQRLFNVGVRKQHIKFSGIQYHLYHKERIHNNINDNILQATIKNNITWCSLGIDGYL
ncbi:glycosyltransferase family 2 protein [Candidatus Pseudothioglobus singularis]|nr:glycosyltransferase family 2 protein [Candidatus Pseudothioglobus singularis]